MPAQLFAPEALYEVVIDHADSLHERIADRRTYEFEAASPQVLAKCVRFRRRRGNFLRRPPLVLYRPAADKIPNIRVEAAELLLHGEKLPGVLNGGFNLQPVPNYPWICKKLADFSLFV